LLDDPRERVREYPVKPRHKDVSYPWFWLECKPKCDRSYPSPPLFGYGDRRSFSTHPEFVPTDKEWLYLEIAPYDPIPDFALTWLRHEDKAPLIPNICDVGLTCLPSLRPGRVVVGDTVDPEKLFIDCPYVLSLRYLPHGILSVSIPRIVIGNLSKEVSECPSLIPPHIHHVKKEMMNGSSLESHRETSYTTRRRTFD
jgi:hypothetical protein